MTKETNVSRRSFMKSVAVGAGAATVPAALTGCIGDDDDKDNKKDLTVFVFGHGVASGDPLSDRVIIWTRITPDKNAGTVATAEWRVATDAAMRNVVKSGRVDTDSNKDFTIKVDVTGLNANTTYYYQFEGSGNTKSVVGKTKTLPVGDVSSVKMAVCSCANFAFGRFNVYKDMVKADADVVVHLGDYIYEYKSGQYPTNYAEGRQPDPAEEIITLDQYRARYNQYRRDADLQELHKTAPFICVWDDHELANDTYKDGAQNHGEDGKDEGAFSERRAAAIKAYHEWLPIRTGSDAAKIDRSFDFGNLLSLHMLDTRMVARSKPISYGDFTLPADGAKLKTELAKTDRTLLGKDQQDRVMGRIFDSGATWQVLGQQVLMGRILVPGELLLALSKLQEELEKAAPSAAVVATLQTQINTSLEQLVGLKTTDPSNARLTTQLPYNLDAWDGYPPAREEVLQRMAPNDVGKPDAAGLAGRNKNLVVLAGDTHNAWASDLYPFDANNNVDRRKSVGVEFATASVTSPGFETYAGFGTDPVKKAKFEGAITALVDDLKYINAGDRGYMVVDFAKKEATCEWRFVSTIADSEYQVIGVKKLKVLAGEGNRKLLPA